MTPPTLHELAGIFMLALAAAVLIAHPSAKSHARTVVAEELLPVMTDALPIDGIETFVLPKGLRR